MRHHTSTTQVFLATFLMLWSGAANASSIHSSQTGDWSDSGTWIGSVVPSPTDSVVVDNGHVITLRDNGSCAALFVNAGDLETGVVLDTSGVLSVTGGVEVHAPTTNNTAYLDGCDGIVMIGGDVVLLGGNLGASQAKLMVEGGESSVGGSISMNNNRARVAFNGTGTLFIGGNLDGNGTVNPAGGTIVLNGTSPQDLGGYTFFNLTIANSSDINLTGNVSINGGLIFQSGKLILGVNNLSIGSSGSISGASDFSYVVTDGSGRLSRDVAQAPVEFPVGLLNSYNPLTVGIELGAETYAAAVEESVSPGISDPTACVQRTWVVSEGTPGGSGDVTMAFRWRVSDEGSSFNRSMAVCWRFDGANWVQDGSGAVITGSDPYVATVAELTTDGRYTIGNPGAVTSVKDEEIPGGFNLSQNFPNPFNPATHINFAVEEKGMATLTVFNLLGQRVATLFDGNAEPGVPYSITFNADGLGSGIYFYELRSHDRVETRRMVYVR